METFDCSCENFMLLSSLVKLGYAEKPVLSQALASLPAMQLPDGGFLCSSRLAKLSYTPKSCYKANLYALLLLAACHKRGIDAAYGPPLLAYFWNHHLFYKESEKDTLILDSRKGWRTIDTFHPFEAMRVGLHTVADAFAALGYGRDERLGEAWSLLSQHKDTEGKYRLKGTLSKSYLPKEKAERPSKWVTFYALLAQKEAQNCL